MLFVRLAGIQNKIRFNETLRFLLYHTRFQSTIARVLIMTNVCVVVGANNEAEEQNQSAAASSSAAAGTRGKSALKRSASDTSLDQRDGKRRATDKSDIPQSRPQPAKLSPVVPVVNMPAKVFSDSKLIQKIDDAVTRDGGVLGDDFSRREIEILIEGCSKDFLRTLQRTKKGSDSLFYKLILKSLSEGDLGGCRFLVAKLCEMIARHTHANDENHYVTVRLFTEPTDVLTEITKITQLELNDDRRAGAMSCLTYLCNFVMTELPGECALSILTNNL